MTEHLLAAFNELSHPNLHARFIQHKGDTRMVCNYFRLAFNSIHFPSSVYNDQTWASVFIDVRPHSA